MVSPKGSIMVVATAATANGFITNYVVLLVDLAGE